MPDHTYIVLLTGGDDYDEPEAFGPFLSFEAAKMYGDNLAADDPRLRATVLPVKPAE